MSKDRRIRAAVLMGGVSSEREVSLHSGEGVAAALSAGGFDVSRAVFDDASLSSIDGIDIDVAFVALHGAFGEDGGVQALLEEAGVAYTGSGPQASRDAMDKVVTKEKFAEAGISTARYVVLTAVPKDVEGEEIFAKFGERVVVKPSEQGSSIGVSIVGSDGFEEACEEALSYDGRAIVEPYIRGRELTVGIVGEEALPVVELRPKGAFFDYRAKYEKGQTECVVGPELPEGVEEEVNRQALGAFGCLGCRDLGRVDMILGDDGRVYVLEVNTIPGFTETSLVPMAAAAAGKDFPRLCGDIVEMALERYSAARPAESLS